MQIIKLSKFGVTEAVAKVVTSKSGGQYYCLTHGEDGRGRWQLRLPLAAREYPVTESTLKLNQAYKLIPLNKQDPRGNPLYLIVPGEADNTFLVLWNLSPGYRGGANYSVTGDAEVLCEGSEAQGAAGRMGGCACPLVLVKGPCELRWQRSGRLYNEPADWVAKFDGKKWTVNSVEQDDLEDAALNW